MIVVRFVVTVGDRYARILRPHSHGSCRLVGRHAGRGAWMRFVGKRIVVLLGLIEHDGTVAIEDRVVAVVTAGCGIEIVMPWVILGKIGGEVADEGVERLCSEELQGVLPLLSADKGRIADDLEARVLQHAIQLLQAQLLALLHQSLKLVEGIGLGGKLVDVMVECLRILYGRRYGIESVMESSVEIIALQAKLPKRPSRARLVHDVFDGILIISKVSGGIKWGIK